ncbi:MAG: hypothetical protein EOO02_06570 [Chitinophagaceae bacterium]|nr:MAG: hypothetical protein EOO02_06570 [Chitinophagaceae bacterium]
MKSRRFLSKLKKSARTNQARVRKYHELKGGPFLQDLAALEDKRDRRFFEALGKRATQSAVGENKALGIPQTYWRDGQVVKSMPDGSVQVLQDFVNKTKKVINA